MEFKQVTIEPASALETPIIPVAGGAVLQSGEFKSPNYITGQRGWKINSEGDAEFRSVKIAGALMEKTSTFTTDVTVAGTETETNLMSFTLVANSLGTSNALFGKIFISDCDTLNGVGKTFRLYYAGTSISVGITLTGDTTNFKGVIDFVILAAGATNSQDMFININTSNPTTTPTVYVGAVAGTAAIDSTKDQTVKVTVKNAGPSALESITAASGIAYLIR